MCANVSWFAAILPKKSRTTCCYFQGVSLLLSRHSRNQTGERSDFGQQDTLGRAGNLWMFRQFASAQGIPADAGAFKKNPVGSGR